MCSGLLGCALFGRVVFPFSEIGGSFRLGCFSLLIPDVPGTNTLPSLRNLEWITVKTEMNQINQALPYISTNDMTELNELN